MHIFLNQATVILGLQTGQAVEGQLAPYHGHSEQKCGSIAFDKIAEQVPLTEDPSQYTYKVQATRQSDSVKLQPYIVPPEVFEPQHGRFYNVDGQHLFGHLYSATISRATFASDSDVLPYAGEGLDAKKYLRYDIAGQLYQRAQLSCAPKNVGSFVTALYHDHNVNYSLQDKGKTNTDMIADMLVDLTKYLDQPPQDSIANEQVDARIARQQAAALQMHKLVVLMLNQPEEWLKEGMVHFNPGKSKKDDLDDYFFLAGGRGGHIKHSIRSRLDQTGFTTTEFDYLCITSDHYAEWEIPANNFVSSKGGKGKGGKGGANDVPSMQEFNDWADSTAGIGKDELQKKTKREIFQLYEDGWLTLKNVAAQQQQQASGTPTLAPEASSSASDATTQAVVAAAAEVKAIQGDAAFGADRFAQLASLHAGGAEGQSSTSFVQGRSFAGDGNVISNDGSFAIVMFGDDPKLHLLARKLKSANKIEGRFQLEILAVEMATSPNRIHTASSENVFSLPMESSKHPSIDDITFRTARDEHNVISLTFDVDGKSVDVPWLVAYTQISTQPREKSDLDQFWSVDWKTIADILASPPADLQQSDATTSTRVDRPSEPVRLTSPRLISPREPEDRCNTQATGTSQAITNEAPTRIPTPAKIDSCDSGSSASCDTVTTADESEPAPAADRYQADFSQAPSKSLREYIEVYRCRCQEPGEFLARVEALGETPVEWVDWLAEDQFPRWLIEHGGEFASTRVIKSVEVNFDLLAMIEDDPKKAEPISVALEIQIRSNLRRDAEASGIILLEEEESAWQSAYNMLYAPSSQSELRQAQKTFSDWLGGSLMHYCVRHGLYDFARWLHDNHRDETNKMLRECNDEGQTPGQMAFTMALQPDPSDMGGDADSLSRFFLIDGSHDPRMMWTSPEDFDWFDYFVEPAYKWRFAFLRYPTPGAFLASSSQSDARKIHDVHQTQNIVASAQASAHKFVKAFGGWLEYFVPLEALQAPISSVGQHPLGLHGRELPHWDLDSVMACQHLLGLHVQEQDGQAKDSVVELEASADAVCSGKPFDPAHIIPVPHTRDYPDCRPSLLSAESSRLPSEIHGGQPVVSEAQRADSMQSPPQQLMESTAVKLQEPLGSRLGCVGRHTPDVLAYAGCVGRHTSGPDSGYMGNSKFISTLHCPTPYIRSFFEKLKKNLKYISGT